MIYVFLSDCYEKMVYWWCGKLGFKLFVISLGFWYNFGYDMMYQIKCDICCVVFDYGIMYFDFVNNYGLFVGLVEEVFGEIFVIDFVGYWDELIILLKVGYFMWDGFYGEWGSCKYLILFCD